MLSCKLCWDLLPVRQSRRIVGCELCLLSAAVVRPATWGSPLCFSGILDSKEKERETDGFRHFYQPSSQ